MLSESLQIQIKRCYFLHLLHVFYVSYLRFWAFFIYFFALRVTLIWSTCCPPSVCGSHRTAFFWFVFLVCDSVWPPSAVKWLHPGWKLTWSLDLEIENSNWSAKRWPLLPPCCSALWAVNSRWLLLSWKLSSARDDMNAQNELYLQLLQSGRIVLNPLIHFAVMQSPKCWEQTLVCYGFKQFSV